jgi:hypothetical protein
MQANKERDGHSPGVAARFAVLKTRLLLEHLNRTPESEIHALIVRQANEAGLLAWLSSYPLLAFPSLFEERAASAIEEARRQAHAYWSDLEAKTQPAPHRSVGILPESRAI